ncbi:zinc finger protein ZFP2-like isoform X2 [Anthonomus grandis grandis]|nr:zinc finger protein ZFP2-like isoform X2 [Anthonomus grandis grandis]
MDKPLQTLEDIEMDLVKIQEEEQSSEMDMVSETVYSYAEQSDSEEAETTETIAEGQLDIENIKIEQKEHIELINPAALMKDRKPNLLKRKQLPVPYSDNIIIQPPVNKFKKLVNEIVTPLVSREEDIYTCLMCTGDTVYAGQAKPIITHLKEAHDKRLYICDVCGMDFPKRNLLSAHVDEHVALEEGDFQCEVCNRIFTSLRLFRIHKRMHLPQVKSWMCLKCNKRYSSKNLLEEHMNTHLGVRPYVCGVCGKDFASKYTFKAHERIHESRPRPFKCNECGKAFMSQQNLTQHEKTHSGVKEYQCHLCNKQFGSSHNLEVHSVVHTGYRPFVCGLCGKSFARKAEIRDHERIHTGERPFQCEFCGATFSQRSNLQTHKRTTHYDDKRYKCEQCNKCFKRRRLLDYHIKAAHTGERPYKCDTCEATFVYPEHFKKHRRIHTGEKPYVCEVCGKSFSSRDNRNAHRFVHSDKKPYECLVCGAGFMRKPVLYQHMQTQNHMHDTIVVNQPRLTIDEKVTMDSERHIVMIDEEGAESKILIEGEGNDDHIIINGRKISFAQDSSGTEETEEVVDELGQAVTNENEDFEEVFTSETIAASETQIIETEDGPVQLVKVKIPNENGEEEEAWIKIGPEESLE